MRGRIQWIRPPTFVRVCGDRPDHAGTGQHGAMSPRPTPHTRDQTALKFLQAGVRLVDALLAIDRAAELPPRLRSLHFPAPLEWIRVEDVLREARQDEASLSAKAFWNRWSDKDSFVTDLAIFAITYADSGGDGAPRTHEMRAALAAAEVPFSAKVQVLAGAVMTELLDQPRSYLLGHLAAVVHHAPKLQAALAEAIGGDGRAWECFYDESLAAVGLSWRPGWGSHRAQVVVAALLDGLLVRQRVMPRDDEAWDVAGIFADAVTALLAGMVDLEGRGRTAAEVLDDGWAAGGKARPSPRRSVGRNGDDHDVVLVVPHRAVEPAAAADHVEPLGPRPRKHGVGLKFTLVDAQDLGDEVAARRAPRLHLDRVTGLELGQTGERPAALAGGVHVGGDDRRTRGVPGGGAEAVPARLGGAGR